MPQLVKKVSGSLYDLNSGDVILINSVSGQLQQEDYIDMNAFIAYLQNLTRAEFTSALPISSPFGLKNKNNIPVITLNINY